MRKALISKIILCSLIAIMLLTLLQGFSFAESENTQKIQMIKKSANEYIIYVSGLLDQEFEFAFSNRSDIAEESLMFKESGLDKTENGNNIAYIDSTSYTDYFNKKEETFLWIKVGEEYKVEAEKIELEKAFKEDEIQKLNQVTKTIEVQVEEKELPEETVNGVTVNRKIGTLSIAKSKEGKYSYKMVRATQDSEVATLIELANQMNTLDGKNIFEQLAIYDEFRNIYNTLKTDIDDKRWTEVKEGVIEQPQDSKKGEQYLVWIKQETEDAEVIDVQIMTCQDEYTEKYEKQEVVIKETTKLPVTADNLILFIIAGIVIVLIIIVAVLKLKNKKTVNI